MKVHKFYRICTGSYIRDDGCYLIKRVETTPQRFVWNVFSLDALCVGTWPTLKAAKISCEL